MEERTSNITLIYIVYFKVMNTICPYINIKFFFIKDKRNETTVF